MPSASVTKPGLSISVPPIRISAPSASSSPGIRPLSSALRSAREARAPPSRLMSQRPMTLSRTSSTIVHHGADDLADLDQHVDLDDRHHHEGDQQEPADRIVDEPWRQSRRRVSAGCAVVARPGATPAWLRDARAAPTS